MKRAGPALALIAGLLVIAALLALGTWQVQRLAWKEALIAQVDARVHADPVAPPATISADDAYTRVTVRGRHRQHAEPLAQQPAHLARERGRAAAEGGCRQRARALGRPEERKLLRLVEPAARVVAAEQRAWLG